MNSVNFVRGKHSVGLNEYHIEWCPKYRYNCMKNEYINKEIERLIRQAAEEHGIIIKTIAVGFDHVHVRAALPFTMSSSKASMLLKGRSAYLIFRRFPNFRLRYPKGSFWSPGTFIRSISEVTSEVVHDYIEKQQFQRLERSLKENDGMFGQQSLEVFF
jgi:putative transposase